MPPNLQVDFKLLLDLEWLKDGMEFLFRPED